MLPLWWYRTCCVYCGRSIVASRPDPTRGWHRHRYACERHESLCDVDPLLNGRGL